AVERRGHVLEVAQATGVGGRARPDEAADSRPAAHLRRSAVAALVRGQRGRRTRRRGPVHVPGPRHRPRHLLVSHRHARTAGAGHGPVRAVRVIGFGRSAMRSDAAPPSFATLVQEFFCVRLIQQQDASARTVASYRDTVRLLLDYLHRVRKKRPTDVAVSDLDAPDGSTWSGHRDRVLFAVLYNTGARVSEAIAIRRSDVSLDAARSVRLLGKGRKQRTVPLWKSTAEHLRNWESRIGLEPNG